MAFLEIVDSLAAPSKQRRPSCPQKRLRAATWFSSAATYDLKVSLGKLFFQVQVFGPRIVKDQNWLSYLCLLFMYPLENIWYDVNSFAITEEMERLGSFK